MLVASPRPPAQASPRSLAPCSRTTPNIALSVSVTTRARRTDEIDGKHYHFIDVPAFKRMQQDGELLESAEVHGNFYGTPRARVEERLSAGRDILFDIDYQGTLQLLKHARPDMVTIFILPPSIKELRKRLERRAQDSAGTIEKRLKNARHRDGALRRVRLCARQRRSGGFHLARPHHSGRRPPRTDAFPAIG